MTLIVRINYLKYVLNFAANQKFIVREAIIFQFSMGCKAD